MTGSYFTSLLINVFSWESMMTLVTGTAEKSVESWDWSDLVESARVLVKLCRFVGKPRLLLIQQRNFWDFLGKLQEKVRFSSRTF